MIFDELCMEENYLDLKKMPYDVIGEYLKSKEEAEALYKVAEYLSPIADNIALYLALNQSCQPTSLNGMEIASKYYLTVEF